MSVRLFIPWGGSSEEREHRRRNLDTVQAYASECFPGWEPQPARTPLLPFTRASACNLAAASCEAEVIVFLDADSIVPEAQLAEAAMRAAEIRGAVRAYDVYNRLSERATRIVNASGWRAALNHEVVWTQANTVSHGAIAFHRQTFVEAGGYDPRFVYFYDDCSFDIRAGAIAQERVAGPLYHLWHQPREAPEADEALWRRYEHEDPFEVRAEAGFPT